MGRKPLGKQQLSTDDSPLFLEASSCVICVGEKEVLNELRNKVGHGQACKHKDTVTQWTV
jgi:hypothetical protein